METTGRGGAWVPGRHQPGPRSAVPPQGSAALQAFRGDSGIPGAGWPGSAQDLAQLSPEGLPMLHQLLATRPRGLDI